MRLVKVRVLLLTYLAFLCLCSGSNETSCAVSLVLIGSTGDLARRYLWPAIFDSFSQRNAAFQQSEAGCELVMYASVRKPIVDHNQLWEDATANIKCSNANVPGSSNRSVCLENLNRLKQATLLVQLKNEDHYHNLSLYIADFYAQRGLEEVGRIFYLAVPPSAYSEICENIHHLARPPSGWVRVVLEKPFGEDLSSAQHLARGLSEYFTEEEIYRVDHYLGKFGVKQIMPFRQVNAEVLASIWNKEYISYVEIAMKEQLDVVGRAEFYDRVGVIRDVFQNHLTEILVQLTLDSSVYSYNFSRYLEAKWKILSAIHPPTINQVILGQYLDYQQHLEQDGVPLYPGNVSRTPTYASVLLSLSLPSWMHVPFILTSGKQLGHRSAFARIVFKEKAFSLVLRRSRCPSEIVFLIQDDQLQSPGILVSEYFTKTLLKLPFEDSLTWITETVVFPPSGSLDCQYSCFHPKEPVSSNAYVSLFEALFHGRREMFVDTESLLRSWRLWTPLLKAIEFARPSVYVYNETLLEHLDFHIQGSRLVGNDVSMLLEEGVFGVQQPVKVDSDLHVLFQAPTYIHYEHELGSLLAQHVQAAAVSAVNECGAFHLALPGGNSPLSFLQSLVLEFQHTFPWKQTHIWQTDERCISWNSPDSNLHQISEHLLTMSPLSYWKVHPMPVESLGGICSTDGSSTLMYEQRLLDTNNGTLDYVLLGLGSDGHVASLFPRDAVSSVSEGSESLVQVVTLEDQYPIYIKQRMTLSYRTILDSRQIGLLIVGERKAGVLRKVLHCLARDSASDCAELPVVKLLNGTREGQLTVYVDADIVSEV